MKVIIDSKLRVTEITSQVLKKIQQDLIIKNPEFQKKRAMGLPVWGCPPTIKLYEQEDGVLVIPRGYARMLWQIQQFEATDRRLALPEINFSSSIQLRDYQSPAIDAIKKSRQGVVNMPCGAGKTETGLEIIAELKQPALWLTHTKDLLNQSLERAKKRLNLQPGEFGIIAADDFEIGSHITFGMVQTMANRDLSQIINRFGCIVIDECHHVYKNSKSVAQFYSVISQFPAKYRIGLTATAHRADGLINTMFHTIGPIIYQVGQDTLNDAGNVVPPTIEVVPTEYIFEDDEPDPNKRFRLMLNDMQCDIKRNELILTKLFSNRGQFNLALGDCLWQLESMSKLFPGEGIFICGKTPKKEREKLMEAMRAGKYRYLFATYQLAKEGLDIPQLNRLYLITPKRDKSSIQQAVGRIMRKAERKIDAIVYDFVDQHVPTCKAQFAARKKVYKDLGAKLNLSEVKNERK